MVAAHIEGDGAAWKDKLLVIDHPCMKDGEIVVTVE
jgi:hypothetical protein